MQEGYFVRFLWWEYLVWLKVQVQGQAVQAKHGQTPEVVGMGKAVMEEGDRDIGKTQTVEESMEREEEYVKAAKKEKKDGDG